MEICGEVLVTVRSYQKEAHKELTLVFVKGDGPSLLGRNWLPYFQIDWNRIKLVQSQDSLECLLQEFNFVFHEELGTITPFKAKLSVPNSVKLRFHRPRSVSYAL